LRILESLPEEVRIAKAFLVAAPLDKGSIEKYWPLKENLAKGEYDWDKIRNSAKDFYLIYSDNDPYDCGLRHGELIHSKIGGNLIIKKGEGHFNLDTSQKYKEFSEILKYL
jgi:predicted alpha/beta hydrolase family esterase